MEVTREQFIQHIVRHDYAYDYSDDHRVWTSGSNSYKRLHEELVALLQSGEDKENLLADCLASRSEQFVDGLTHKIINQLFKSV